MALKFTDEMLNKALDNVYGKNDVLQKALDNVYGPQTEAAEVKPSAAFENSVEINKTEAENKNIHKLPSHIENQGYYGNLDTKDATSAFGDSLVQGVGGAISNMHNAIDTLRAYTGAAGGTYNDIQDTFYDVDKAGQVAEIVNRNQQLYGRDSEYVQNIQKDIIARNNQQAERLAELQEKYKDVKYANRAIMAGQGIGNLAPSMAVGALTGVAGAGTAVFGANVFGGAMGEALNSGATMEQATGYALADAAMEIGVEMLFGGIPYLGKGLLGKSIGEKASELTAKYIKTAAGQILAKRLADITGEGIEEVASSIIEPFLKRAFYDKNAENATLSDMATAFGNGALVAAILGVANFSGNINEYQEIKANINKDNLQTTDSNENTAETAEENKADLQQSADKQRAEENLQIVQELAEQGVAPQSDVEKLQSVVTGDNSPKADPKVVERENARVAAVEESARQGIATAEDVEKTKAVAAENIRQSENKAVVEQKFGDEEINRINELANLKGYKVVYEADESDNAPNGYIKDGVIYINTAGNSPYFNVAVHEVLHGAKGNTDQWNKLENSIFQLIGSDGEMTRFADNVVAKYTENPDSVYYKSLLTDGKLDQTKVNEEIVANFVEEYLPRIAKNEDQLMEAIKKDRSFIDGLLDIIRGIKNNLAIKFAKSEKAMLDEAERNLVNLLRAENNTVDEAKYSYGGVRADNIDIDSLNKARTMNRDNEIIRQETGWFKGADGEWRFEIDDSKAVVSTIGLADANESDRAKFKNILFSDEYKNYSSLMEKVYFGDSEESRSRLKEVQRIQADRPDIKNVYIAQNRKIGSLQEFLQHDELYRQYPVLKNLDVIFDIDSFDTTKGAYDGNFTIHLNENLKEHEESLKSVLLHEIQHFIQQREGFENGITPDEWVDKKADLDSGILRLENTVAEAESQGHNESAQKLRNQIVEMKKQKERLNGRSAFELYQSTYGEQEARDVQARMNMSAEERKQNTPFMGDENTVFADGSVYGIKQSDSDGMYSRQIDSYPYDGESAKSRGIRKKAVDQLADNLGRRFGITGKIGKEGMRKEAYRIADKVEKLGYITKADMDNFFDAAVQAARFTDEKADYADLKKRIRETGIEPVGGREYLNFLQKYKGKVKFKRGGMPIDTLYQRLAEEYPEYINTDIINPEDMMWELGRVYDVLQRKEMTVSEYYGDRAQDYINESYAEYAREVDLFVDRINSVSRYKKSNVDKKVAKDREKGHTAKTYTLQDVQNAYKNSSRIEKEITKLMADTALTDEDKSLLEDLQKIKNPTVLAATLKDMQENNPNAKAIYKLYNLKQELAQVKEPVREYRKVNRERNRQEFMDLLTTSKSWREKHKFGGLRYKAETFERIIDDIVTDKKAAERLKDMLPRSIHKHVAEGNRYKNELRDRIRRLNLDNKKLYNVEFENKNQQVIQAELTESGLVQIYGEGLVTKEYLDKIGADVVKITESATEFRKIYNELIEKINESYVRNGYKPIEYRRDYFPHFMEDGTDVLLNKMTSWFGIDAMSKIPASWQRALGRVTVKSYTNDGMLPTEIAGTTYKRSPGRKYNAHALQRMGENTVYDALKGFDNYLETAADVIFLTDDIQNLRSFEDTIRYKFSDKGIQEEIDAIDEMEELSPQEKWTRKKEIYDDKQRNKYLNNFVGWLHNYTNLLAGKKDFSDRVWEENLGRGVYRLSKDMESRVAANMVAGNISSAMTNFIPIAQMTTQVKEKYVLAAMSDTVKNMGKSNDGFVFQSDFLTNRFGSEKLVDDSLAKKLEKTPGLGQLLGIMETVDEFTSNVVVRGKYMQNIKEGMSHEAAMKDADEFAAGLMADRSKGALPTIFETKNPVAKAMTMFQVEQNNQLQYLLKDLPRSLGEKDEIGKLFMMALLKYSLYSWLYNWMYEKVAGRKPAFSPIDLVSDTGRDFYRVAKGDMKRSEAVTNAVVRGAEELPFAAAPLAMSGLSDDAGRLPISGALPDMANVLKLFDSEIAIEKKKSILYKELSKPMYYLLFPVAGGQVKKTGEALHQMIKNDGVSYYTNNKGEKNVQFAIDTSNPLKVAQSAAFGRWSTEEARDYVNSGFDYLSKSESQMYDYLKGLGIDNNKAYKQAAGMKAEADSDGNGYLKTEEVKRYLDKQNMSKQDKANLFSILLPNVKNNPYK